MPTNETLSAWIREWKSEYCPGAMWKIELDDNDRLTSENR